MFKHFALHSIITLFFMGIFGGIAYMMATWTNIQFLTAYILACITWITVMVTITIPNLIEIKNTVRIMAGKDILQEVLNDLTKGNTDEVQ